MGKVYSSWHYTLLLLKTLGLYSSTKSKRVMLLSLLYIILTVFLICMTLIQFSNINGDVFLLVNNLEAFFAYAQILGKVTVTFIKQDELTKLLEKAKNFWKTDVCPDQVKIKLNKISASARKVENVFFCCVVFSVLAIVIYALLEGILPIGVWSLENYPVLYKWTLISQIIMTLIGGFSVCIFDCLFFAISIQTIIQFKILCQCLTDLRFSKAVSEEDQQRYYEKLKMYIQYHNFLLGFLKDLQNYYSAAFVVECLTIAPLICTEMYAVLDSVLLDQLMRHSMICFSQTFQLTFYCVAADFVGNEALAVGDAVYSSEWYSSHFHTLGKPITLLIQKSQQPVIFSAGGLFEIKARTVLTVLRISWSACTVMRGLKQQK